MIVRIDVLLLDLQLVVLLAPGSVVGPQSRLRLFRLLLLLAGRCCRSLLLRLVLLYLRQAPDDVLLFLLLGILLDEQRLQLSHILQQDVNLVVRLFELLLEVCVLRLEHTDKLVLIHTAKVIKKDETTKKNRNYF